MTSMTTNQAATTGQKPAEKIIDEVVQLASSSSIHQQLLEVYGKIEGDEYLEKDIRTLQDSVRDNQAYWDLCCVLAAYTTLHRPAAYLEIGVRRGRSASVVAAIHPSIDLYLFDLWHADYAGVPNPGPDFVHQQLDRVGHRGKRVFHNGYSQETVPAFFNQMDRPKSFSMMTIDGDHRDEGARRDLDNVIGALAKHGMLVFDDIVHPTYPTLCGMWRDFVSQQSGLCAYENLTDATGTALAIRA